MGNATLEKALGGLLVLSLGATAVALWPALRADLRDVPGHLRALDGTAATRSRRALEAPADHVPQGLPEVFVVADLLRPVFEGMEPLTGKFVLVLPGSREDPHATLRAHSILLHELSPFAWPLPLPLGMLEGWIGDPAVPGGLHPELLAWIEGSEVFVFQGIPREGVERVRRTVADRVGVDLLVPGVSAGDRVHVLLLTSLRDRIARGEAGARRFRGLLP